MKIPKALNMDGAVTVVDVKTRADAINIVQRHGLGYDDIGDLIDALGLNLETVAPVGDLVISFAGTQIKGKATRVHVMSRVKP